MALNYTIIGENIKYARKEQRLTQEKLAEIVNKSPSYISYIETGKRKLSLESLVDIANALYVSADELLSFNIAYRNQRACEFSFILGKCSIYEQKIINDIVLALKQSLEDSRSLLGDD
ncbi:MAG: helix-turn-helix transcriptional regulator [Clostridia bacterium]|nr:helix-turn-helix transcriptional regulator [Clostridia bacterium]